MHKSLIILAGLCLLGAGTAAAQDFKPSNANALPGDPGQQAVYTGETVTIATIHRGFNASDAFGPNEQNSVPRHSVRPPDIEKAEGALVTSSTTVASRHSGYSAADHFGPSARNDCCGVAFPARK
ncbi:hypothetical protein [Chelativorans salis]|uniref:Uncharacterized protein n=1 Tax=Chelativorans salis TaxID=2978478 RepID=A0ABT2LTA8_9HYPH|nr:hypothetical protein [Chelativorans sp. EGI FJ00035]MCT7376858.1 hypothetical protein [Chelativorans sp. EGI FJ00035]